MSEVIVIGHRNPDTDAICSAIGYAEFKKQTGMPEAIPARCGDTNARTDFVLRTFGVASPIFIPDVSPKVKDVMQTEVISVNPDTTAREALSIMDQKNIRVLPVLDSDRKCLGLVSIYKMIKFCLPVSEFPIESRRVTGSLNNIAATLNARMENPVNMDEEKDLILMIGAMSRDAFEMRLRQYPSEKLLVIVGNRDDIQELAIDAEVNAVVVSGGFPIEPHVAEKASAKGIALLLSPHDTATTAMLCRSAIPVGKLIHQEYKGFHEDEFLADVKRKAVKSSLQAFPVFDHEKRVVGLISKSDFLKRTKRRLILVDHNELTQAVHGADQMKIIEIIDHHRIRSLSTNEPILFKNEPVGSTCTIVAEQFFQHNITLSKNIAGILLGGVVSDTLNLTSPTTTDRDAEILKELEKISETNANEFTDKLFASGSLLTTQTPSNAICSDSKEYREEEFRFTVAQIEEIGFSQFWKLKTELQQELETYRNKSGYFFSALLITDVMAHTSLLVVSGNHPFIQSINYPKIDAGIFKLDGVVSRKKQLIPYLTHCLAIME